MTNNDFQNHISRLPNRQVFTIDIGKVSLKEAEQIIKKYMKKFKDLGDSHDR